MLLCCLLLPGISAQAGELPRGTEADPARDYILPYSEGLISGAIPVYVLPYSEGLISGATPVYILPEREGRISGATPVYVSSSPRARGMAGEPATARQR